RDNDLAFKLLRACEKVDADNLVAWMAEVWLRNETQAGAPQPIEAILPNQPQIKSPYFNEYGSGAARARIRVLEQAGYSAYAARRLGFMPEAYAAVMARDLAQHQIAEPAKPLIFN